MLLLFRVMLMMVLVMPMTTQVHVVDHHIEQSSDINATSVVIEQVQILPGRQEQRTMFASVRTDRSTFHLFGNAHVLWCWLLKPLSYLEMQYGHPPEVFSIASHLVRARRVLCLHDAFHRPRSVKFLLRRCCQTATHTSCCFARFRRTAHTIVCRVFYFSFEIFGSGGVRVDHHNGAAAGEGPADGGGRGDLAGSGGALRHGVADV